MQANVHCASSGADVDTSNSITSLARNNDSETAFLDSFYEKIPFKTEG